MALTPREIQMYARYLPGSGTGVDPNASRNAVQNRFNGDWRQLVPKHNQAGFQEFMNLGNFNSYQDYLDKFEGGGTKGGNHIANQDHTGDPVHGDFGPDTYTPPAGSPIGAPAYNPNAPGGSKGPQTPTTGNPINGQPTPAPNTNPIVSKGFQSDPVGAGSSTGTGTLASPRPSYGPTLPNQGYEPSPSGGYNPSNRGGGGVGTLPPGMGYAGATATTAAAAQTTKALEVQGGGAVGRGGMAGQTPATGETTTTTRGTDGQPLQNQYGIGVDEQTGRMTFQGKVLDPRDPRLWGTAGYLGDARGAPGAHNPKYTEIDQAVTDEAGNTTYTYRWKPETLAKLNGRVQLDQSGVGGFREVIDPTKVTYDPEFGFLTSPDNISKDDPGPAKRAAFIRAAILALGAGAAGGFLPGTEGGALGAINGTGAAGTVGSDVITGTGALTESIPGVAGGLTGTPAITAGTAGSAAGGGLTLGQVLSGARTVAGAVGAIGGALGGGGGGGRGTGLGNAVAGGVANYQANRNMSEYERTVREMIERGDPYGPHRADAIRRLGELESNPGALANHPLFKAMQEKSDMNLQRTLAARGYLGSGNEMGALHENFSANLNKFYGEEWNRIAKEAGVEMRPDTGSAINSAGRVYSERNQRDAGLQAFIQRNGGLDGVWRLVNDWLTGDGKEGMTESEFDSWWNDFVDSGGNVDDSYGTGGYDDPYGAT